MKGTTSVDQAALSGPARLVVGRYLFAGHSNQSPRCRAPQAAPPRQLDMDRAMAHCPRRGNAGPIAGQLMGGRPSTCTDTGAIIAELDRRSRERALTDWESRMLERALAKHGTGKRVNGWTRELVRLGVKRSGTPVR